jgi:dienelactone hydrolase
MDHSHDPGMAAAVPLLGVAAGVPYVALPPTGGRQRGPLVVAWHGLDPPRNQQAMAATLPLVRLAAWRVYLGLPMTGAHAPAGGPQQGVGDVMGTLVGPMVERAVAELPAAVAALRTRLPVDDGPIGLLGGQVGAAVALLALAEATVPVRAAALVRPMVQLERVVGGNQPRRNPQDQQTTPAGTVAGRLDFLARVSEIAARDPQPAVLLVGGAGDDAGVGEAAERLWQALAGRYRDPGRVALLLVPGLAPALAAEPGTDPAPHAPHAARVDAAVTGWLGRHLTKAQP